MFSLSVTYNLADGRSRDWAEEKLREVSKKCDDYLVVREDGTKNGHHWHCAFRTRMKQDAFRIFFRRHMELTSQQALEKTYAVKKWDDGVEWLRYCCKGPTGSESECPDVLVNSGYDVSRFHREFFEKRLEVLEKNAEARRIRKSKPTLRDRFVDFCKERGANSQQDVYDCLDVFLRESAEAGERIFVTPAMACQWVHAVCFMLHPVSHASSFVAQVIERMR